MLLEKTVGLFVRKNVWNLTISSESVEWTDWPDSRIEVVLTPAKPSGVLELEIFLQVSPQSKSYLQINVKF